MSEHAPVTHPFRVAELSGRKPIRFSIAPDADQRARLAALLGLIDLRDVTFKGELRPVGRQDVELTGTLGATAVQPCVVTNAPVTTRIEEPVLRRYVAGLKAPEGDEIEMPEDDSVEPLPAVIDAGAVMTEALALALPLYPRAEGAELGEAVFAAPGTEALRDGDLKPFAGLAALKDKLGGGTPG